MSGAAASSGAGVWGTVNIVDRTIAAAGGTAGYRLDADGDITHISNSVATDQGDYVTPIAARADYEVFVQVTFGTLSSSSGTNVWLQLGVGDLTWTRNTPGSTCIIFVQIRHRATQIVVDTATITLTVP